MKGYIRALFVFLWFLFLPNTIYLITDLQYLTGQLLATTMPEQVLIFGQFVILTVLGIFTYFYSMEPVDKMVKKLRMDSLNRNTIYIALNFMISYAVILGKVQRTHSSYLFTDPGRVARDMINTFTSNSLLLYVLLFGILVNTIFFMGRMVFKKN
jgi:uncharacterized membrane protein